MITEILAWIGASFFLIGFFATIALGKLAGIRAILNAEIVTGSGTVPIMNQVNTLKEVSRIVFYIVIIGGIGLVSTGIAYYATTGAI